MKEATGELSMVVITLLIVVAVIGIWTALRPMIQNWVGYKFKNTTAGVNLK